MPNYTDLIQKQKDLYKNLEEAIKNRKDVTNLFIGVSNDDLLAVLTTANITEEFPSGKKRTVTPLGLAIGFNDNRERVKAILDAIKDEEVLKKVLTTANITEELPSGKKRTVTPLGLAWLGYRF